MEEMRRGQVTSYIVVEILGYAGTLYRQLVDVQLCHT